MGQKSSKNDIDGRNEKTKVVGFVNIDLKMVGVRTGRTCELKPAPGNLNLRLSLQGPCPAFKPPIPAQPAAS